MTLPQRREAHEENEGVAPPVAIGDPPAGILIEPIEQDLKAAEEPDRGHGCSERFKIFREKPFPEILAEREQ